MAVAAPSAPAAKVRSTERVVQWRSARATIDRGLFKRQYRAVKINDLSSLYPANAFRERVLDLAKRWVRDYEKKGYRLVTAEADILVYGPFQPRDNALRLTNRPGRMRAAVTAAGEDQFPEQADVAFFAQFTVPYTVTNDRWEVDRS